MVQIDVVDKKKYPSMLIAVCYQLSINSSGRPLYTVIFLILLIGLSLFIGVSTPDSIGKFLGFFLPLLFLFVLIISTCLVYRSVLIFDGFNIWIQFKKWKLFKGNISELTYVKRYDKAANGKYYFPIKRGSIITGFSLYRDDLPDFLAGLEIKRFQRPAKPWFFGRKPPQDEQ